jgi:hypothetical protein
VSPSVPTANFAYIFPLSTQMWSSMTVKGKGLLPCIISRDSFYSHQDFITILEEFIKCTSKNPTTPML